MIYDYLFYKSYQLAKRSKSWEDTPMLFGIMVVGSCLAFNVGTIVCLIDGAMGIQYGGFDGRYKYLIAIMILIFVYFYFFYKKRFIRMIKKYHKKNFYKKNVHPVWVIAIYYIGSILLLVLSAMYKNGDGVFSGL